MKHGTKNKTPKDLSRYYYMPDYKAKLLYFIVLCPSYKLCAYSNPCILAKPPPTLSCIISLTLYKRKGTGREIICLT